MRPHLPLLTLSLLLAGCTMGPNYAGPPPALPGARDPATFARADGEAVTPAAPVSRWWEGLNDAQLNALVEKALAANPDAQAAAARLQQARAALRLEQANGAPQVNASALYAHARLPGVDFSSSDDGGQGEGSGGGGGSSNLNLYNVGFDASWEIDLFGGRRRSVEAARAEAEASEANLADVQVSLTAEVTQAYVNLRDRQQRIALARQSLGLAEEVVALTRQRHDRGTASELDVAQMEQQREQARNDLATLEAQRDSYLDELATLVGEAPGTLDGQLAGDAPVPLPPAAVAIGDPAALIRRRPDIRAAERALAASTARIGVAEAAQFPQISFMGLIGLGGTSISDLTKLDDVAAIAAPQLRWSFLDFGRNKARIGQARATRDEAEAQYRAAVLAALRDAEGALSRFTHGRTSVAAIARAQALADRTADLSGDRYDAGTITRVELLDTQRRELSARQNLSLATASLTGDFISIQKALGLGWAE